MNTADLKMDHPIGLYFQRAQFEQLPTLYILVVGRNSCAAFPWFLFGEFPILFDVGRL